MVFQNPKNEYVRHISFPRLWTLVFGPFYFLFHGVWRHVFSYLIIFTLFICIDLLRDIEEGNFLVLFLYVHIIYALSAARIIHNNYIRKGWERIVSETEFLVSAATTGSIVSFLWKLITK